MHDHSLPEPPTRLETPADERLVNRQVRRVCTLIIARTWLLVAAGVLLAAGGVAWFLAADIGVIGWISMTLLFFLFGLIFSAPVWTAASMERARANARARLHLRRRRDAQRRRPRNRTRPSSRSHVAADPAQLG